VLSNTDLKNKMMAELAAQGFDSAAMGGDGTNWLERFCQAIANAIVDECHEKCEDC